jgi:uncharacterized protein (TIGR02646 family)
MENQKMRPVNKGVHPVDDDGNEIVFKEYGDARPILKERLGRYCSYCEMRLPAGLHLEHVQSKSKKAEMKLLWDNFLLACPHCNSRKGSQEITLGDYLWPDKDNTYIPFEYISEGLIRVSDSLHDNLKTKAEKTIALLGLGLTPDDDPLETDDRWQDRREIWGQAMLFRENLTICATPEMRQTIEKASKSSGYWSFWMTIFKDDENMLNRFIAAFPGTSAECFDSHGTPINRSGGQI